MFNLIAMMKSILQIFVVSWCFWLANGGIILSDSASDGKYTKKEYPDVSLKF